MSIIEGSFVGWGISFASSSLVYKVRLFSCLRVQSWRRDFSCLLSFSMEGGVFLRAKKKARDTVFAFREEKRDDLHVSFDKPSLGFP